MLKNALFDGAQCLRAISFAAREQYARRQRSGARKKVTTCGGHRRLRLSKGRSAWRHRVTWE